MTREEAAKILDVDNISAKEYKMLRNYNGFCGQEAVFMALKDACSMAVAALREQEERRWIPVAERLPEIYDKDPDWSKTVLFRTVFGHIHSGYRNIGRPQTSVYDDDWTPPYWIDESENLHFEEDEVTHWMPLPEPPKEDEK